MERWPDSSSDSRLLIFCCLCLVFGCTGGGRKPKRALLTSLSVADCSAFSVVISLKMFGWLFFTDLFSALCQPSILLFVVVSCWYIFHITGKRQNGIRQSVTLPFKRLYIAVSLKIWIWLIYIKRQIILWDCIDIWIFYAPEIEDRGAYCFCPVCHSVIL